MLNLSGGSRAGPLRRSSQGARASGRLQRAVLRLAGGQAKESAVRIPKACPSPSLRIAARFLYILLKTCPGKRFAVHVYVSAAAGQGEGGDGDEQHGRISISNRFRADREVERWLASPALRVLTLTSLACLFPCLSRRSRSIGPAGWLSAGRRDTGNGWCSRWIWAPWPQWSAW